MASAALHSSMSSGCISARSLHPRKMQPCSQVLQQQIPKSCRACRPLQAVRNSRDQSQEFQEIDAPVPGRRAAMLGMAASAAAAVTLLSPLVPLAHAEPFLTATGGKGILAEEEQLLYNLRLEKEGEARREIAAEREKLEQEARNSQIGKLCATPFGIDIVGITEFVALVGALVGGITARQRKAELERLNEQLRKINLSLRQQARAGTVYAPGLSYAPPTNGTTNGFLPDTNGDFPSAAEAETAAKQAVTATITLPRPSAPLPSTTPAAAVTAAAAAAAAAPTAAPDKTLLSMEEEEMTTDQIQCRDALRAGKRFLKEANGSAAMVRFEKALMLSKAIGDKVQERRATRGLAASARLQGQYRNAIKHLEQVLDISRAMREYTGDADAFGTIADCYTDLDEFEKAAEYYDKYIQCMNRDGPV